MKKLFAIASFIIILAMAFGTVNVYANTDVATDNGYVLDRGGPNTNAGGGADKQATKQTERDARTEVKATQKAERQEAKLANKKYHFRGEVTAVAADTLSVTLKSGEAVVFGLTEATVIKIPTLGQGSTWEDLNVGVDVLVTAVKPGEEEVDPSATVEVTEVPTVDPSATPAAVAGEFTAVKVQVVPGKPTKIHRVGVVTEYVANEKITIEAKGELFTFELSEATKILPEERVDLLVVGARVTVISRRDPTGGPLAAQGIVVHPEGEEDGGEEAPAP